MIILLLFFFLIFTSVLPAAEIYQWHDANGKIHFSDIPQAGSDQVVLELQPPDAMELKRSKRIQKDIALTVKQQSSERKQREKAIAIQQKKFARKKLVKLERCEKAKQRLVQEQIRWKNQRRKGYKELQKARHNEKQEQLEIQVGWACEK